MQNDKNLCICLGYESLVIPLSLINEGKEVIVYSYKIDILRFCKFQKIPFIKAPAIRHIDWEAARFPNKAKRRILNSLKSVDVSSYNIHVTHKPFGLHTLVMAIFAKKAKVFFHRTEIDFEKSLPVNLWPAQKLKRNIKYLIFFWFLYRFLLFLNYRLFVTYRYFLGTLIPIVKDEWFKKNVKIIEYKDRFTIFLDVYSKCYIDVPVCKNLFLFTDIDEMSNYVEKESLIRIHEFVLGHDVTVKGHPNRNFEFDNLKQYPPFIPAELLIERSSNAVVGLASTTLGHAALRKNIKSISFIDLVKWTDISKKNFCKDNLTKSGGKIFFPQTLQELDDLLS